MKTDFAEILREKMQSPSQGRPTEMPGFSSRETSETASFQRENVDFPSHLAYLMGQIPKREWTTKKAIYPVSTPTSLTKNLVPHTLEGRFLEAFCLFSQWGEPLTEAFSRRELKLKFRKLALRLHPDQRGDATQFVALRDSFRCLLGLTTLK